MKDPPLYPCPNNNSINALSPDRQIKLIFGSKDKKHKPPDTEKRKADKAFAFDFLHLKDTPYEDIGIVHFSPPVITSSIWPLCLPKIGTLDYSAQKMILVGYGQRRICKKGDGTYACYTDEEGPAAQALCDSIPNGCNTTSPPPNVNEQLCVLQFFLTILS